MKTFLNTGLGSLLMSFLGQFGLRVVQTGQYEVSPTIGVTSVVKDLWTFDAPHGGRVGDNIILNNGNLIGQEFQILSVPTSTTATVNYSFPVGATVPAASDTVRLMRPVTASYDSDGALTVVPGPTSFLLDGITTSVSEDTGTPSSTIPLPVKPLDENGNVIGGSLDMVDTGTLVDTSTLSATFATVKTFTVDVQKIRFVNNSGNILRVGRNGTQVGYCAPGEKDTFDAIFQVGDTLDFRTESGAGATGALYLSYFG